MDVLFEFEHVVEVVLDQSFAFYFPVGLLVEVQFQGVVLVDLRSVLLFEDVQVILFPFSVKVAQQELRLGDVLFVQEAVVYFPAVLGDQQHESFEAVGHRDVLSVLIGHLQSVDEINEFALGGLDVFLGVGVHVHEEVEEGDDFGVDFLVRNCVAVEVEVDVVLLADVVGELIDFWSFRLLYLYVGQHFLDEEDVEIAGDVFDVVFEEGGVVGDDVLVDPLVQQAQFLSY
jgi:hypothetical protein